MNRIGAEIYEFNEPSIKLFESNGFQLEGRLRQYIFKDGVYKDELLYSLLREDWEKRGQPS